MNKRDYRGEAASLPATADGGNMTAETATRVYRFGLLPPTEGANVVRDQLLLAHRFRNTLTEIERGRRAALRANNADSDARSAEVSALIADADVASRRVDEALAAIALAKSAGRTAKVPQSLRNDLTLVRVAKRDALRAVKDARAILRADVTEQACARASLDRVQALASELRKSAAWHSGVYWGTKAVVVDAIDRACEDLPIYDMGKPCDPRFLRWSGEGTLGAQVIKTDSGFGASPAEVIGGETNVLRIEAVPTRPGPASRRREQRRFANLRMRVGSNADRSPVWAVWPMVMHREMPAEARVKIVRVHCRRVGPREEWYVTLTVTGIARPMRATRAGAVAVNMGWRVVQGGIRVATWADEQGERGECVLSEREVAYLRASEGLASTRRKNFTAALAALTGWARERTMPAWWPTTLAHWRSQASLHKLVERWGRERFDGDADAYRDAEAWRYHDRHLWQYEADQRRGAERHRLNIYRNVAARLAARYDRIVLDDMDLRELRERPGVEEPRQNDRARSNAQMAAPGELRQVLRNAFHGHVDTVQSVSLTRRCAECGSIEAWNQAEQVHHACRACGVVWDQDDNNADNLLRVWREQSNGGNNAVTARTAKSEGKWARAKRMKGTKEEWPPHPPVRSSSTL